jgi:hypothetical protein
MRVSTIAAAIRTARSAQKGSTLVRTLRQTYGEDFAPGVGSDMKLDTLLERTGAQSLTELVKKG